MTVAQYPSLLGNSVFISGGAGGIGASLVKAFARQGAYVTFVDTDQSSGNSLAEEVRAISGAKILFQACDIREIESLQKAINYAQQEHGGLGILINNVGDDARHSLISVTEDSWKQALAVNLNHVIFAAQAVAPHMRNRGKGSIINIGSICHKLPNTNVIAYAAAKAAVHSLTRSLAKELGKDMIRVNTLSPGWVMTEKQKKLWLNPEAERLIDTTQCLPVRILAEDIAEMALFLGSDASRCCTAQEFIVDAGWV